jgi:hypothetical protein
MSPIKNNSAIVAHDAGAANHILSWVEICPKNYICNYYFCGPAKKIFKSKHPNKKNCDSIVEALQNVDYLICGTGWQSSVEIESIKQAKKKNIYVIAVLDHWANYMDRFKLNEKYYFPDKIWVTDHYAKKISIQIFPTISSEIKENTYAKNLLSSGGNNTVKQQYLLYICEPIRSNWGDKVPGEFQAIRFFFRSLHLIGFDKNIKIKFRVHPSEELNKYDAILKEFNQYNISLDINDLGTSLKSSFAVIACQSYVLHISTMLKIKTFSSLPPWAPATSLPHDEIIYLRDL